MSAAGLLSARRSFTGLRPVRLRQDLADIADLIEYCFAPSLDAAGRATIREMRALSRTGPLLWLSSWLSGISLRMMRGFVWFEQGRLVGNVSVSPSRMDRSTIIANVAVHPDYRRQGIARRLMVAALEQVAQRGDAAVLQVEADNVPALALYRDLGFRVERTFTCWRRPAHTPLPDAPPDAPPIRQLACREASALYALANACRPNEWGGMGWQRPTERRFFRPPLWAAVQRVISGQSRARWVVPGDAGALDAAVIVERRVGCSTLVCDVLARRDDLVAPLLVHAIRRLGHARPLLTEHPADDTAAGDVLRSLYFRPERTLTHMIWQPPA